MNRVKKGKCLEGNPSSLLLFFLCLSFDRLMFFLYLSFCCTSLSEKIKAGKPALQRRVKTGKRAHLDFYVSSSDSSDVVIMIPKIISLCDLKRGKNFWGKCDQNKGRNLFWWSTHLIACLAKAFRQDLDDDDDESWIKVACQSSLLQTFTAFYTSLLLIHISIVEGERITCCDDNDTDFRCFSLEYPVTQWHHEKREGCLPDSNW